MFRHVGDFGNVYQYHGNVDVSIQDHLASLVGDNSIIGKAIVVCQFQLIISKLSKYLPKD